MFLRIKIFEDFADIYATSKIFILKFLHNYQNQWHFGLPLAYAQKFIPENFNLRQISGNP